MGANESWICQGRQYHGWFGTGTCDDHEGGGRRADLGDAEERIRAVARGAVASLPNAQRTRFARQLDQKGLARLAKLMAAWAGGSHLDKSGFAERFFGRAGDDAVVEKLRSAALGADTAKTHADLRDAASSLASAVQTVGLDRWPRFLEDAEQRMAQVRFETVVEMSRKPVPSTTETAVRSQEKFGTKASAQIPTSERTAPAGVIVFLPNGQRVADPDSPTGFLMSPTANLEPVAAKGRTVGEQYRALLNDPESAAGAIPYLIGALIADLGQGGTFDYQRKGNFLTGYVHFRQFRDVSNFNVGLYCQQAGLSLDETLSYAGSYAKVFSGNAKLRKRYGLDPQTAKFIRMGYKAGESGIFGQQKRP